MAQRSSRAATAKRSATTKRAAAARQPSAVKRSNGVRRANGQNQQIEHRPTFRPSRKTLAATIGSAISAIALYYGNSGPTHVVSPEIAGMLTVAATFVVGWIVPPGARERIIETARGHRTATA